MTVITIKELDDKEFRPFWFESIPKVFTEDEGLFTHDKIFPADQYQALKKINSRLDGAQKIHLVAYDGDTPAGWCTGYQQDKGRFYMFNSGVLPDFRRKGIYSQLVDAVLKRAQEEGYQEIYSFHKANNNAVIIPKLKKGFVISGTSISPQYGFLVKLSYFPSGVMQKLLDYRIGGLTPDEEILTLYS